MGRCRQSETLSRFHDDPAFLAFRDCLDLQPFFSMVSIMVAIEYRLRNPDDSHGRIPLYEKRDAGHPCQSRPES